MAGLGAEALDVDAEQPPGAGPALLERQLEHHAWIHRHRGPGVVAQLTLELPGLPAGVAERDEGIRGALAARHGREHVARGGHLDAVGHLVGVVPLPAGAMQHEAAVGVYRPAAQHRLRRDVLARGLELHLRQHVREPHGQRLVENDAERALVGVLADERDRLGEVRVGELRHRDQQVVREASPHGVGERSLLAVPGFIGGGGAGARRAVLAAHTLSMGMEWASLKERLTACRARRARRRTATRRRSATRGTARPARPETGRKGWRA